MFFTFVFSLLNFRVICSFKNSQCRSIAATIMALSLAESKLSAISMSLLPFRSIHIFATECRVVLLCGTHFQRSFSFSNLSKNA